MSVILSVCAFTEKGKALARRLEEALPEALIKLCPEEIKASDWTKAAFEKHLPVVFIGATGIAVRMIAPFVNDKLTDSPVIVIDEKGTFVIPLLSGHVGAANEIAMRISDAICGTPVITTATDVEKIFSVDVFARKNYLRIENRDGIKKFSAKLLNGVNGDKAKIFFTQKVSFNESDIPENVEIVSDSANADILLTPKKYTLGIGCKKGKSFEKLKAFVEDNLNNNHILVEDIAAITSIDIKAKEEGLLTLAYFYKIPFITFSKDELEGVEGDFTESVFVKEVTGVSNVCERAALCLETDGELLIKKTAHNGMTFAVARHEGRITTWET